MLTAPLQKNLCPTREPPRQRRRHQRGHALIEWLIVCLPLICLGSLLVEVSDWHTTRQRLALAAQRATTRASLEGGQTHRLWQALENILPGDLRGTLEVCVTDPVRELMQDFKDARLSQQLGFEVIRHDHIAEQHRRLVAKGWPQGQGPRSRRDISTANRLHVVVTLSRQPSSPWVRLFLPTIRIQSKHQAVMQSHRRQNGSACIKKRL